MTNITNKLWRKWQTNYDKYNKQTMTNITTNYDKYNKQAMTNITTNCDKYNNKLWQI